MVVRFNQPCYHALSTLLLTIGLWSSMAIAVPSSVELELEPRETRRLLSEARKLARHGGSSQGLWRAAVNYCKAARLGSIEAQYQLGMLYAFGEGVPEKPALAAALFSLAGQQGHHEAQQMLETVPMSSSELPGCMMGTAGCRKKTPSINYLATNSLILKKR